MNQKTKLLLSAICLFAISGTAQISFVEHIIVGRDDLPQPRNARKVIAVDIDGDKDKDVLSVSTYYGTIVWFENLGGIGNFSTQKIIALDLPSINTIDVADVDGDGDVDIISGSRTPDVNDGKAAFFLNDGQGNFGEEQVLHIGGKRVYAVQFADLDGDGHPDALWGTISGEVGWQKNEDGMGTFGESQVVSTHTVPVEVLTAHDMDGDGDLDVLAAYSAFNIPSQASIRWYENLDGVGNFGSPIVLSPFDDVILDMVMVDMNKDGRDDLLYGSYNDRIAWFPSTDGMGSFGEEILISTRTKEVTSIFPVDVNGDGDVDILSTSFFDENAAWYQNLDGEGEVFQRKIISDDAKGARDIIAVDMDEDGDMDVLLASSGIGEIVLYENSLIVSTSEAMTKRIEVSPNPTTGMLTIGNVEADVAIQVYDSSGKLLLQETGKHAIDLSPFPSGLYFYKITDESGNHHSGNIVKE